MALHRKMVPEVRLDVRAGLVLHRPAEKAARSLDYLLNNKVILKYSLTVVFSATVLWTQFLLFNGLRFASNR